MAESSRPSGPAPDDDAAAHTLHAEPAAWETRRPLLPELALIAATGAYGATFKIVQDGLEHVTPVGFILLRFTVASLVLAPLAFRLGWRHRTPGCGEGETGRAFVGAAALFGVVGFAGYWFQNAGLQHTSTSNSAFVTGLFVVFTPIIEMSILRRLPPRNVIAAVVVAAVGLFFLTGARPTLGRGDALTLGCAFFFGAWIYLGGEFSNRFDPVALTAAQMVVLALLAAPVVAVDGLGEVTGSLIVAVLVTGVFCSAGAFTLQLWGQRYVEPSRAAVILLFEPVVAGVVGYAVGERLGWTGYFGALVIFAGILLAESRSWRRGPASGEERGAESGAATQGVRPARERTA